MWRKFYRDIPTIRPSLTGYIAQGIALCGKQLVKDARTAFNLAFTFTDGYSDATLFLFLIKAIALFNVNEHKEAMPLVEQLAADPNTDPLVCRVLEASLQVQLGTVAFEGANLNEAVNHFAAAVLASIFLATLAPPSACKAFTMRLKVDTNHFSKKMYAHTLQSSYPNRDFASPPATSPCASFYPVHHEPLPLQTSTPSYTNEAPTSHPLYKFRNHLPQDFSCQPAMLSQPLPPLQHVPAIMTKHFSSTTLFVLAKAAREHNVLGAAHGSINKAWESIAKDLRCHGVDVSQRTLRSKLDALLEWHADPMNCSKAIQNALEGSADAKNMHEILQGLDNLRYQNLAISESKKTTATARFELEDSAVTLFDSPLSDNAATQFEPDIISVGHLDHVQDPDEDFQHDHHGEDGMVDLKAPVKRSHGFAALTDDECEFPVEPTAKRVKRGHDCSCCSSYFEVQVLALLALERVERNAKTEALIEQMKKSTEACMKAIEDTRQQFLTLLYHNSFM
ncbi:hypothetical protein BDR03DRAFT_1010027 [Suillus americanus]|nr:hypothetical protein BDR03DRAFT_1010027 [Suillus americanus]